MLAAKVMLKDAERVKQYLIKHQLLHPDYLLVKEFGYIYFPLQKKAAIPRAEVVNTRFSFPQKEKPAIVEDLLREALTPEELVLLPKSQEAVGTILILEIPEALRVHETMIAEAYLRVHHGIETVVRKDQLHEGTYRTRKVKILAGKQKKETTHMESGLQMKLHLERTYFSARLGNERLRIAKEVKPGEMVLVMFSGVGPYPLVLAKKSRAKQIFGIEMNPWAHQYAAENVQFNHLEQKISLREGDVRSILPKLGKKFDRIVMPLPKTGEEFLPLALRFVNKGGMIHLYAFLREEEIPAEKKKIKGICKAEGHLVNIIRAVTCGQFSPRVFRVCFDIKVR